MLEKFKLITVLLLTIVLSTSLFPAKLPYFKLVYCPMCWADHAPLIKYDASKPVNLRHSLDIKAVDAFYRPILNTGVTHIRLSYQCFGRDEDVDLRKLLLPWIVTTAGKVDFSKKNDNYFIIARRFFVHFTSKNVRIIFNALNGCENNMKSRLKWSPFLKTNNVQGIDGLDDPRAIPYIRNYLKWCLADLNYSRYIEWQPVNEADPTDLPVIKTALTLFKAIPIGSYRLHYSTCIDLGDDFTDSTRVTAHHAELMLWRDLYGHPAEDIMDRWLHGMQVKEALFKRIVGNIGNWVFVASTDGRQRSELTAARALVFLRTVFDTIKLRNMQLSAALQNKLKFTGIEHMITGNIKTDIAILNAWAQAAEKYFGEKFRNRGRWPAAAMAMVGQTIAPCVYCGADGKNK